VAVEQEEIPRLEGLFTRGNENGVKDLRMVDPKEIKEIEPNCEVCTFRWFTLIDHNLLIIGTFLRNFKICYLCKCVKIGYNFLCTESFHAYLCAFVQIIEFILGLKSSALTTHWNH
jgi:hypothetical protein